MKKIDIDNHEITEQEALKYKDFDKVMNKFNAMKPPFYKSPFFGGGAITLLIIASYFILNTNPEDLSKAYSNSSYQAEYNSPINIEINHEKYEGVLIPNEDLIITTNSGTRIIISANALVDSLGNLITGSVNFKYREFLDQKDIFLSGIPMNYDSAEVKRNFESGGMFELLAYQKDQPLFIANDKSVKVELASKEVGNNFNLYYYSPEQEKWIFKENDKSGFSKEEVAAVDKALEKSPEQMSLVELKKAKLSYRSEFKKIKQSKPIKPVVENEEKFSFTINVDYNEFPELTAFKGLKFEVSDKEKNFNVDYAKEQWDGVNIYRGETRAEYSTCFRNKITGEICFITNPVFAKKDIANANISYSQLLDKYEAKKDSLKARKKRIKNEIAKRTRELEDQKRIELNRRAAMAAVNVENRITRSFQISNFGIWNSDCPQKLPTEAVVNPIFVDENGQELTIGSVFLVLKERNEVISLNAAVTREGIPFNPNEECMLWTVTKDLKNVAIVNSVQFDNIKKGDKTTTFEVELIAVEDFEKQPLENILNI